MRCALAVVLAIAFAPTVTAQEVLGFHVRGWVQWDDQRIELGDGYVGGPRGIQFVVKAWFEGATFAVTTHPWVGVDSTAYDADIETRIAVSDSLAPTRLFAIDRYRRVVRVSRGEAAQMILPFHPEPGESATLNLQIEGPRVAPPPSLGRDYERIVREPRDVWFRRLPFRPALAVTPDVCDGAVALRLSAAGRNEGVEMLVCEVGGYNDVVIPGVEGQWVLSLVDEVGGRGGCLVIFPAPPRGPAGGYSPPPSSISRWCLDPSDRWAPVSVRLPSGQGIRAQLKP